MRTPSVRTRGGESRPAGAPRRVTPRTEVTCYCNPPRKGFADLHAHFMANEGFGGMAFHGKPFGDPVNSLRWCTEAHGVGGTNDWLAKILGAGVIGHLAGGHPQYDGWPRWNSFTHQAMADRDSDGIEDAIDNCSDDANADQADKDQDALGDKCDPVDDTQVPDAGMPDAGAGEVDGGATGEEGRDSGTTGPGETRDGGAPPTGTADCGEGGGGVDDRDGDDDDEDDATGGSCGCASASEASPVFALAALWLAALGRRRSGASRQARSAAV